eukprot:TRINITY_DN49203_c0_g1_i2.p1 TRINITY_DN49203_c0_g1~~TRINITY_DN49203_c0_g1_i2.p1  ORF type:complete len:251 (+),score=61.31 TRINITY_DN49203_c0_g1_i2:134-886(+)
MCIRDRYQRRVRGSTNGLGMGNLVCYDDNNACTTARDVAKTVYTTETDEHGVTTTTISTYDKHGKLIERARSEGGQDSETFASLRESMGLEETEDSYRMSSTSLPACNESLEEFKAAMLEGHNKYRAKHSAPEVKWSDSCARNAQLCVDHCQATGSLSHSHYAGQGQNVYFGHPGRSAEHALDSWYSEIKDYDFEQHQGHHTGHFTQIVWKQTVKIGAARSSDGEYIACNYDPPGNWRNGDEFKRNVTRG